MSSRIPGFYQLSVAERQARLSALGLLDEAQFTSLDASALTLEAADGMIENVIGQYSLPFATALNFVIDGKAKVLPMVVEEASIVAAASYAAKMVADCGGFISTATAPVMIGQVQITDIADVDAGMAAIAREKPDLLDRAKALLPRLVARGGGPVDITVHELSRPPSPDGGMIVVHLHVDCRDAMGANLINSLCEALGDELATIAGGEVGLRILTNYSDERTVTVRCTVTDAALASTQLPDGRLVRKAVAAASRFASLDPYRATTHNKGIMNGVDAVLVATGQDWRAVEAGAHAYAARSGVYRPLATWTDNGEALLGEITMPMAVGSVGGALHVHPGAKTALQLASISNAAELAVCAAAAGLATNLAALRALATEGISRGHLALHARSVARAAGAVGGQVEQIARALAASGEVKLEQAKLLLARTKERL